MSKLPKPSMSSIHPPIGKSSWQDATFSSKELAQSIAIPTRSGTVQTVDRSMLQGWHLWRDITTWSLWSLTFNSQTRSFSERERALQMLLIVRQRLVCSTLAFISQPVSSFPERPFCLSPSRLCASRPTYAVSLSTRRPGSLGRNARSVNISGASLRSADRSSTTSAKLARGHECAQVAPFSQRTSQVEMCEVRQVGVTVAKTSCAADVQR
ncbi:hypothetical protein C8Q80DRAFT_409178 [Daedaleopsis nitida]|nr:hypothetical protein C8Q80DRAFT_409178 [Daedaleopsis nitida]